jgi:dUTP pyrophosphatase
MARRKIRAIRLLSSAVLPRYAQPGDSGLDLCAAETVTLRPGQRSVVRTGFAIEIPRGFEGQIRSRSGLARDCGVVVLNSPGTIDSGYRGEVLVLLANFGEAPIEIGLGMRIAHTNSASE